MSGRITITLPVAPGQADRSITSTTNYPDGCSFLSDLTDLGKSSARTLKALLLSTMASDRARAARIENPCTPQILVASVQEQPVHTLREVYGPRNCVSYVCTVCMAADNALNLIASYYIETVFYGL